MYYKKRNNKPLIFIVLLIVVIVGILFLKLNNNKPELESIDTSMMGDASIDPENIDNNIEGAVVDVEDVEVKDQQTLGIDISKWQGKIDWKKVKNANIQFAFIRIGYRGEDGIIYKDDYADYNIQQAIKNDVLVGVYFYSTALNEQEAHEEALWTLSAIKTYPISYPVIYDCESYTHEGSRIYQLGNEQRTLNALTYLDLIKDQGYDTMFYGSLHDINDSLYWNMDQINKKHKVWVAQYPYVTYPAKLTPDYDGDFDAWQYTNKGKVNGVSNDVDMVVCYFENKYKKPADKNTSSPKAKVPLTDEEKLYQTVNEKVTAKDIVNLRSKASTNSDIVGKLKNGEVVTRIGIGTNGWSKLSYNNKTVYAISSYLTKDLTIKQEEKEDIVEGNVFESKKDSVTAKDVVNLRSLPTTNSEIVGKLKSGDFLDRVAISNKGWSRLKYNGQYVYAISSYLSNKVVKVDKEENDGFVSCNEQVTAKSETNLRTKPSTTDSEVVYTLKNGEYIKCIGKHNNGWSKLEYNGQIVYAISSYLTK